MTLFLVLLVLSIALTIALLSSRRPARRGNAPPYSRPTHYRQQQAQRQQQPYQRQDMRYGQTPQPYVQPPVTVHPIVQLREPVRPQSGFTPYASRVAPEPTPARRASVQKKPAQWLTSDERCVVGPYVIDAGMIYVGEHLPSTGRPYEPDPALIDPRLPVDAQHADNAGEGMTYWPSYSAIDPRNRAGYLAWLAGGRKEKTYVGYAFLFFYGLERRLLSTGAPQSVDPRERDAILIEVERLLELFRESESFNGYARRFLDFVRALNLLPQSYVANAHHDIELPLGLRVALGQFVSASQPIPVEWAFAWARSDPEIYLRTPAVRCAAEFRALFDHHYTKAFASGFLVTPGKRMVSALYKPASQDFRGLLAFRSAFPDVATLRSPRRKLARLMLKCTSELDAYSRWVGRHPESVGSLAAQALLPPALLSASAGGEASALLDSAVGRLGTQPLVVLRSKEILKSSRTKADVAVVSALLATRQVGIEPDPNYGGPLPNEDGAVVLFRSKPEKTGEIRGRVEYRAAALMMHLAVMIAIADGTVDPSERRLLMSRIDSMAHLTVGERARLHAHVEWLLEDRPGVQTLKKRLTGMTLEQRNGVADFLVRMACADGRVDPAEVKALEKIFEPLGFDSREVHRRLHATMTAGAIAVDEPVVMQKGTRSTGFALPQSKPKTDGFALDQSRIDRLEHETNEVAKLLGDVFSGDEETMSEESAEREELEDAQKSIPPEAVGSISPALAAFARKLAEKESWPRSELETIARSLDLLPDGALEQLNDAALDAGLEEFSYGDDPVSITKSIVEEICS